MKSKSAITSKCLLGCGLICQNGNLIMAIAFFTVYRVYKWKEIKAILPTRDYSFLNPLIYYMNIAKKKAPKSMFLGKLPFWGQKMHFTQKQKLFQKLWAIIKQMKKLNCQNILFWEGSVESQNGQNSSKRPYSWTPNTT